MPDIRLMDFTPEAEAYTNRFPALTKVVLRQGAVEFDPLLPTDDITLLSTTVALVVRPDMQPALVSLLTHAVVHNPKSGFDKNGDPVLFYRAGRVSDRQRPGVRGRERGPRRLQVGRAAVVLKTLAPRAYSMGVPFSYTAFVNTHWTTLVGMLGVLAILLPLTRALPALYVWTIRRRLVYWYRQLKALERNLDSGRQYDAERAAGRVRPHRLARSADARAALLLQRALRPARAHRSGAPATCREAHADQDGGRVAALPIAPMRGQQ